MKRYLGREKTRELIEALGGPSAASRVFGVKPPAVTYWIREGGKGIEFNYLRLLKIPENRALRQIPMVQEVLREV